MLLSCRIQSIDLLSKSVDWFLYDNGLRHERVTLSMYVVWKFMLLGRLHSSYVLNFMVMLWWLVINMVANEERKIFFMTLLHAVLQRILFKLGKSSYLFCIANILSRGSLIRVRFLRILSHLLKKPLMENFIFCAMSYRQDPESLTLNQKTLKHNCNHCDFFLFALWTQLPDHHLM